MTIALDNMTQARWASLTPAQREAIRDYSDLSPQLAPFKGWRVECVRRELSGGETVRFIVGQSTGWRPCSLELARRNSSGGMAADRSYQSVRALYRVRPE